MQKSKFTMISGIKERTVSSKSRISAGAGEIKARFSTSHHKISMNEVNHFQKQSTPAYPIVRRMTKRGYVYAIFKPIFRTIVCWWIPLTTS